MSSQSFAHQDDGGTVSLFSVGTQMLFACTKGHWWILTADSIGSNAEDSKPSEHQVTELRKTFGADAMRMMKLQD